MTLKTRRDLKGAFSNGKMPTQREFAELIDSTLNKRDDCFMGKWKPGATYRTGDVVIYNKALWVVPPKVEADGTEIPQEICAHKPPKEGDEWSSLIVPVQDDDWEVHEATGAMFAKIYECVGIGRVFDPENSDTPDAKLEVVDEEKARFLIFPKAADCPNLSLFQIGDGNERDATYFLLGLDNEQVGLTTDAPAGFTFRRGEYCEPGEEADLNYCDGDVLMVIKPDVSGLARVGISTAKPEAMLHITDGRKGEFLFNPEDKDDPVFTIVNLDPACHKNYLASGVGLDNSVFVTDAPKGFLFKQGSDYGDYCKHLNINQGNSLVIIQANDQHQPRVGIGTEEPCAMLHITDGAKGEFILIPEDQNDPALVIANLNPASDKNYLTSGVGTQRAVLVTDTPKGFAFKTGGEYGSSHNEKNINQGENLVVMLADGKVGIGTREKDPEVRLEVTDENSGKFLFNLDDKHVNPALAIINTRNQNNYFTLGADNQTAVFVTDSRYGFAFKQGDSAGINDNETDVTQGDFLLKLLPERPGAPGTTLPPEAIFFPSVSGKVGIRRPAGDYQLDVNGLVRAYNLVTDTDETRMSNEQRLKTYFEAQGTDTALDKIKRLKPLAFDYDVTTGLAAEGKQIGLKAQDVQDIIPEVVKVNNPDQTLGVGYQNLVPVLIQAMKEQQDMITDLKNTVAALEMKVARLLDS